MVQILVTIDTEISEFGGLYAVSPFETHVEGKVNGQKVGYRFIMDLLGKYGIKGEFFVDIYAYGKIGEEKFSRLCKTIHQNGHNVQLHTHPSTAFDNKRPNLHQYTLEEQIKVIKFGMEKIREWIGFYPLAHRAGMYGINKDTFEALACAGIFYDCSYFFGHQNCKFQCDTVNKPFYVGNVTELPVTVYKNVLVDRNPIAIIKNILTERKVGKNILINEGFRKLDISQTASLDDIKKVINDQKGDPVIVLFLHSSSFLKKTINFRKKRYESICVDDKLIKRFQELLDWISRQSKCVFKTIDTLEIDFSQKDYFSEIQGSKVNKVKSSIASLLLDRTLRKRNV